MIKTSSSVHDSMFKKYFFKKSPMDKMACNHKILNEVFVVFL